MAEVDLHGWFIPHPSDEQLDGLPVLEPRSQFDQCIVGVVRRFNDTFVLYDQTCIIEQLVAEDYGAEDAETNAWEHYEYNIVGGWIGDGTPGFLMRPEE